MSYEQELGGGKPDYYTTQTGREEDGSDCFL